MKDYQEDLYRIYGDIKFSHFLRAFTHMPHYRFIFCWRKITAGSILKPFYRIIARRAARIKGIEIPYTVKIGGGLMMYHPWGITINSKAVIGNSVTLYKGVTIGNTVIGSRKGSPVIGNRVFIGLNSTVVGGITIGNDVLIAPNTYVNFDVPDHSLVIGSPGVIHHKDGATDGYITHPIPDVID